MITQSIYIRVFNVVIKTWIENQYFVFVFEGEEGVSDQNENFSFSVRIDSMATFSKPNLNIILYFLIFLHR